MAHITFRLNEREHMYARKLAKFNNMNLSEYLRSLIYEQAEDFEDMETIKEIEKDMLDNPEKYEKTYTLKEVFEELEL